MSEIKTARGILKYRMPNILEAYDVLDASGVATAKGGLSDLKLKKNIIMGMGFLVDFSGIEGVSSYEELLEDVENFVAPLSTISDEVIQKIFTVFKKKHTSLTLSAPSHPTSQETTSTTSSSQKKTRPLKKG